MYPVRQNAATQSRPAKSIRVLDVCPKCVLPELMRSIYSKWLRKGFFSLPRQCSHRKNASAAKPQEAVQADRHSSERKSLIFSSLPQKSGVCLSANAKTQPKKSNILPFRAVSIIPQSGARSAEPSLVRNGVDRFGVVQCSLSRPKPCIAWLWNTA